VHLVVSGAPASGKSTVATAIGRTFRLPVLSLDVVKETLADSLGLGGEEWSNSLGDAAAEVVFRLALDSPGSVAEGWWRRERRNQAIEVFAGRLEVFCTCDPEVAVARAAARIGDARHPIHRDVINPRMLEPLADVVAATVPLGLDDGLIEVDTTDGVELGTVLDHVRWLARSKPM
jgi:predicted kinase